MREDDTWEKLSMSPTRDYHSESILKVKNNKVVGAAKSLERERAE